MYTIWWSSMGLTPPCWKVSKVFRITPIFLSHNIRPLKGSHNPTSMGWFLRYLGWSSKFCPFGQTFLEKLYTKRDVEKAHDFTTMNPWSVPMVELALITTIQSAVVSTHLCAKEQVRAGLPQVQKQVMKTKKTLDRRSWEVDASIFPTPDHSRWKRTDWWSPRIHRVYIHEPNPLGADSALTTSRPWSIDSCACQVLIYSCLSEKVLMFRQDTHSKMAKKGVGDSRTHCLVFCFEGWDSLLQKKNMHIPTTPILIFQCVPTWTVTRGP